MWYVAPHYACLLLKDGTSGESEGGFHLFLRQPCMPQSRVWSNTNSSWVFDTRGLQRSKILPVTYLRWFSSSFGSEWTWQQLKLSLNRHKEEGVNFEKVHGVFYSPNFNFFSFFKEGSLRSSTPTCWCRLAFEDGMLVFCYFRMYVSIFLAVQRAQFDFEIWTKPPKG